MPTTTYTPLANITLTGSAASVTFSSLAAGYRDLVLVSTIIATAPGDELQIRVNGDTGTNYTGVRVTGNGSTASSGTNSASAVQFNFMTFTNSDQTTLVANLLDFSATDKHKTVLSRYGRASSATEAWAHRWASTSAITSIGLFCGGSFAAGSTFALYGVAA